MPTPRRAKFFDSEATAGLMLLGAAVLAMVVVNAGLAEPYRHALGMRLGPLPMLAWINDGLMALFFLLMTLEIKREFVAGELATRASRALPVLAAAGGMLVPALLYLAVARGHPEIGAGWAIPTATDIAFAVGVVALLGRRVPRALRLFLVTLAIVDDMGAIAIVAVAYSGALNAPALAAAAVLSALLFAFNRWRVTGLAPYAIVGLLLWGAMLLSGIHATIAGVIVAIAIPLEAPAPRPSPLRHLETGLRPWVNYAIVPLFGFANAGLAFTDLAPGTLFAPLPLAIVAGLFFGKQAGVFAVFRLYVRFGLGPKPAGVNWLQVWGVALLCGIGFTMSLFIGGLAFGDPRLLEEVKIGVFGGSLLSAAAGIAVLRFAGRSSGDAVSRT